MILHLLTLLVAIGGKKKIYIFGKGKPCNNDMFNLVMPKCKEKFCLFDGLLAANIVANEVEAPIIVVETTRQYIL